MVHPERGPTYQCSGSLNQGITEHRLLCESTLNYMLSYEECILKQSFFFLLPIPLGEACDSFHCDFFQNPFFPVTQQYIDILMYIDVKIVSCPRTGLGFKVE